MAWFFGHIPNKNPNSAQAKGTSWPKNTLFSLTQTITVNSFHQVSPGSHAFKSQDTSSTSLVANSLVVTSKDRRDSSWWKIQVFLHLQPRGHMHKHAQTCENYGLTPSTWFWVASVWENHLNSYHQEKAIQLQKCCAVNTQAHTLGKNL